MLSRRRLDIRIEGTGFNHSDSGSDVDLDRIHPLQTEHDAAGNGRGSTGEAAARTPRNHRYAVLGRPLNRRRHLRCVAGSNHGDRNSSRWVPGPVEAVLLAAHGVGAYGIAEDRH